MSLLKKPRNGVACRGHGARRSLKTHDGAPAVQGSSCRVQQKEVQTSIDYTPITQRACQRTHALPHLNPPSRWEGWIIRPCGMCSRRPHLRFETGICTQAVQRVVGSGLWVERHGRARYPISLLYALRKETTTTANTCNGSELVR
jgi:hypothetical protein